MHRPRIYIAHPISGGNGPDVFKWFDDTARILEKCGFEVMSPLSGKGHLRTEMKFRAEGHEHPLSKNHAIFERDHWMCTNSDFILTDLTDTVNASIGCMMELAWASDHHVHSVVVIPKENIHRHAFVLEAADIVYETLDEAMAYLSEFGPVKNL
jgi:nucleoside 2-deoxyribosyltransferase